MTEIIMTTPSTITVDMRDKYQAEHFQVVTIKAHLKLVKLGMTPPRGITRTFLMQRARELTGASISDRDYDGAIKALEARRDALLTYVSTETP
jgi:hypothetical protein